MPINPLFSGISLNLWPFLYQYSVLYITLTYANTYSHTALMHIYVLLVTFSVQTLLGSCEVPPTWTQDSSIKTTEQMNGNDVTFNAHSHSIYVPIGQLNMLESIMDMNLRMDDI